MLFVDKWLTGHVSDHSALNHRKNVASALAAASSGQCFGGPVIRGRRSGGGEAGGVKWERVSS